MSRLTEDNESEAIADEIIATFDRELTAEQLIFGMAVAIRRLAGDFPEPDMMVDLVIGELEDAS